MIDLLQDMIDRGGWVLIGIGTVSVIAWTLILLEWQRLARRKSSDWSQMIQAAETIGTQPVLNHQPSSDGPDSPASENTLLDVLRSTINTDKMHRESFEAQVLPFLRREEAALGSRTNVIAVLASTMPLMGLLGTVFGMIQTFDALTLQGESQVDALANGISQALITTQAGLVIAVPVILANGYLNSRIRRYLDSASLAIKKIESAVCLEGESVC